MDAKAEIRNQALTLGFDAVGFARPDSVAQAGERLAEFIALGRHGDMGWLADKAERRMAPPALWPDAKCVVVLGLNYGPERDPLAALRDRGAGVISVYAQGRDYHDVVKGKLKRLGQWMHHSLDAEVKVFVDTAPVLEKPLAQMAGLGWQGKHTNLVSREFGSWLFLGAVFTTLDLAADAADEDHCGTCRACLDVCPTAAFPAPYQLDARRCISYLTIEHAGAIPREFRKPMGNRIYGCDDCLAVCPWNKYAQVAREAALRPREALQAPRLAELAMLDDPAFRKLFAGTAVKRTGRDRFVRNVAIALGNSRDAAAAQPLRRLLADASPLVRAMAVWGLAQILPSAEFAALAAERSGAEPDAEVRAEWNQYLSSC
ncbi:MAG TPA: tRNA epoxyqueuosine(34) reductase QueG [Candidatus Cybelea sp.]|nr:tRNA epoxyqueuosine(34) reductase QueG [Candidatus Cybelea sp.]